MNDEDYIDIEFVQSLERGEKELDLLEVLEESDLEDTIELDLGDLYE